MRQILKLLKILPKIFKSRLSRLFSRPPVGITVVNVMDMRLAILSNEDIGWRLLNTGEYEKHEMAALKTLINRDDTCLDVGANIGIYSTLMGMSANEGLVYAVEPIPLNRTMIRLNSHLNGLENIEILDCILGDSEGPTEFNISVDSAYSSIIPTERKATIDTVQVECRTIDSLFADNNIRIDVIKIDVEGSELLVLMGAKNLLSSTTLQPRALLVELKSNNQAVYGYTPNEVVKHLYSFGYSPCSVTPGGLVPGWPNRDCSDEVVFINKSSDSFHSVR